LGGQWNGSQLELALTHLQQAGVEIIEDAPPPDDAAGWVWEPALLPADDLAGMIDDVFIVRIGTLARGGALFEATQSGYWTAARV
jgi:2,4-dienoyl-CoA reductase (NADPH2)